MAPPSSGQGGRGGGAPAQRGRGLLGADASAQYLRQGLMAAASPVPFVGQTAYFAGTHPDSTLVLLTVSLSTRALTFAREGDRYRATYAITADLRSPALNRRVAEANEFVRVVSYTETQSTEERVIFQRFFQVRAGSYHLSLVVRDQTGGRASLFEKDLVVPDAAIRGLSSPVVVHRAERRDALGSPPKIVASPRSSGIFGRDSVILAYVETYGRPAGSPLMYGMVNERGTLVWKDSVVPEGTGNVAGTIIRIPVTAIGSGTAQLRAWGAGMRDSVQAPLFVGFGEELPVASFNDMLSYLRYYVNAERLSALRQASEDQKPSLWAAFLLETDPNPATQQHEGMLAYFSRIKAANDRFRDEAVDGWLTDRGKVFATLGEPDQLAAGGTEIMTRTRSFAWEYQRYSLRLFFQDRTGLGRIWMLDPASEADFNAVARRERVG